MSTSNLSYESNILHTNILVDTVGGVGNRKNGPGSPSIRRVNTFDREDDAADAKN